jgi:hypothetical protein
VIDEDVAMSDLVLFELPTLEDVEVFCATLRPRWRGWSIEDGDVWLFAAELREEETDLATLLREAQALIAELALPEILICVDDRVYCLEARAREAAAVI